MGHLLREHLENKQYDGITSSQELTEVLTEELQAISHDKHMMVFYGPMSSIMPDRTLYGETNFGFHTVEVLGGNIGYLDFRGFASPDLSADTMAAAMNFLAYTRSLILDLRQNGGGMAAMEQLFCSYFFPSPALSTRLSSAKCAIPSLPGKRYVDKDVYILTSMATMSAAEGLVFHLKATGHATIVGEMTAGATHKGSFEDVGHGFTVFVPKWNPDSAHKSWEGTGIKPDIEVIAALALNTAHAMALKKAIQAEPTDAQTAHLKQVLAETEKEGEDLNLNSEVRRPFRPR
jgi:C-terminal processing protease CtpA/Prc